MAFKRFFVVFDSEQEKQAIIDAIIAHNSKHDIENVGEELILVVERQLKKTHFGASRCLIFSSNSGEWITKKYFSDEGINLQIVTTMFERNLYPGETVVNLNNTSQ